MLGFSSMKPFIRMGSFYVAAAMSMAVAARADEPITSESAFSPNATFDWGSISDMPLPFDGTDDIFAPTEPLGTAGGVGITVDEPYNGDIFQLRDGTFVPSVFPTDEVVDVVDEGKFTISFSSPIYGIGFQIYTTDVRSDGAVAGDFYVNGSTSPLGGSPSFDVTGVGDDSDVYVGVASDVADINSVTLVLANPSYGENFYVGELDLQTSASESSVPDGGATITMLGAALTGISMFRRRFAK